MYWISFLIFLQTEVPHVDINYNTLELLVGILVGLVPGIITAYIARRKWLEGEKGVVQSQAGINQTEAIENIAQAASLIATQSQALTDKSAVLIGMLEAEVVRQNRVIEEERALRFDIQEKHEEQIAALKLEITNINTKIETCSTQLQLLINDLRVGIPISKERLDKLEQSLH